MKKLYYILLVTFLLVLPTLQLQAQSVDLLWQGETYVSPFYKGRALWSKQSRITLVALPQGISGNPANLTYKWIRNGTVLGNINGVGKNTLAFTGSVLSKPETIKIEILSGRGIVLASQSTTITPISPILVVYENNPLYGFMFHREINGTHELKEREVTFTAFPFFFSASNRRDSTLTYEWRTNAGGVERGDSVTYRTPDNASGSSEVRVNTSHKDKIMQDANKNFLIQFENLTDI